MRHGITLLVAVLIVAWLTAAAAAVRAVSRIWLRHWIERGGRGSAALLVYLERPHRLVIAAGTAVALTVVTYGVSLGADAALTGARRTLVAVIAGLAFFLFGQLLPRAVARRWPTPLVPVLVPVLRTVDLVLAPAVALTRRLVRRPAGGTEPSADESARDNLEDLLREGEIEGVGERDAMAIISGVVTFGDKTVRDVMTPRDAIFAIEGGVPTADMAVQVARAGYSRVPIYDGTLDRMIGMVHVFDIIKATPDRPPQLRPIAYASADTHCNDLLSVMLRSRLHLMIVRDDTGRTVGLVTLDDLLEELVGDIRDEHDEPTPATPADV
ncbi:MAG TPA: CNNM domain-containing protein [Gemmatimonadaceae bacterium]|nr:CNNM domain-containing protein [Gemmatimonadaceae bacterium]